MSKILFNKEQVRELSTNENVAKCGERSITYKKEFKIRAVTLYGQGQTSTEIFRQAGLGMLGKDKAVDCLRRWKKIVRKKGEAGLEETRGRNGGRPKTKNLSDTERIKWLEAKVAYLKAENDFLARLRAKRTE